MKNINLEPTLSSGIKELTKSFENILSKGYDRKRSFDLWIDFMLLHMSLKVDHFGFNLEERTKIQEDIQELLNYYREENREYVYNIFLELFQKLGECMTNNNVDVLGEFYMIEITRNQNGQFFTPPQISNLIAKLLNNNSTNLEKVNDPVCGSGGMLLELARTNPNQYLVGQDIDITCVKMCALNLALNGLEGEVIWGNTLIVENRRTYFIRKNSIGICHIITKEVKE